MISKIYKKITPISTITTFGKEADPIQSMQCRISNNTQYDIILANKELSRGEWGTEPPSKVPAQKRKSFNTWCSSFQDMVGSITYSLPKAEFTFYWSFIGGKVDRVDFQESDPKDLYTMFFDVEEINFFIDIIEK